MNIILSILMLTIGQADSTKKIVNYSSRNIVYYPKKELVVLMDSAQVSYGDVLVKADSIEYDLKTKTLSAFKNVDFFTSTEKVDGIELYYNLDTKRGFMRKSKTAIENGFVEGKELWLVKEKTLQIVNGHYTTCEHDPPHYYFYSWHSKVLIDNTAIAEPVVLTIRGVPVIGAPFWFFPISKNRKSGLLPFKFGQSNIEGKYAKGIAYYLVINDYSDVTLMLDVMEKKGFQPKLEGIYIVNPYASGQILASYIYELDAKRGRYSVNAKHRSKFFLNSNLDAYLDFQSDQSYLPDYAQNPAQWLKKEVYSQVSVNREFKKIGRGSLLFERRQDFEKKVLDWKFPSISANFYRIPLVANWSITPGISYSNLQKKSDSTEANPRSRDNRIQSYGGRVSLANPKTFIGAFDLPISFSYRRVSDEYQDSAFTKYSSFNAGTGFSSSQNLFNTLNITEGINYNHALTFQDSTEANVIYDLNMSSNLTLYRLFSIGTIGIENILHRVTPSASFNLTPQTKYSGIWGMPRLDTTPQSASLGFSVNNTFQGKFLASAEKRDIANISLQSNYNIETEKLSPLSCNTDLYLLSQTNLNLISNINFTFPWQTRPINQAKISNLSVNSNFNYAYTKKDSMGNTQGIRINLNHFFTANTDDSSEFLVQSNMLVTTISIEPRGWRFDFNAGYNLLEPGNLTNYSISVWKDLHCWEAVADFNKFGSAWSYDFKLRIKKIPDISVSKGILGFVLPY